MKKTHKPVLASLEGVVPLLRAQFGNQEPLDGTLALLCEWHARKRDWQALRGTIEDLAKASTDISFFTEVSLGLLELAENALTDSGGRLPGENTEGVGQTALVLVTELGLYLADKGATMALGPQEASRVVDYITSSLLAKSNVNNSSLRLSLVSYFSKISRDKNASSHLIKVLNRFGQSMLDELFHSYFSKQKKEHIVMQFFLEHLHIFFLSSPSIADMAQSSLKHAMLKYSEDFPSFLMNYAEYHEKESLKIQVFTRLCVSLLRSALDVSKGDLAEKLGLVLREHLHLYASQPRPVLQEEWNRMNHVLGAPGLSKPMAQLAQTLLNVSQECLGLQAENHAIASPHAKVLGLPKKPRNNPGPLPKILKFTEKISPLDCLIRMAS